ncbi:MAG: hypothetical protein HGA80_06240 [Candidatus Omnitrophica bacterium]|nr:hypothetical protein [Candidatus Omnitrophota bacterium]
MIEQYEPTLRSECLCGSGKRFKDCCKNSYLKGPFNSNELFQRKEYRAALKIVRAHITWYRLCHRAHTVPLLKSKMIAGNRLLETDILALSELLDLLFFCYKKCGIINDYLSALDYFSNAIQGDRWKEEFDYHRAVVLYVYRNDIRSVLKILNVYKWQDISSANLLSLYLDVKSTSTNAVDKIMIAEKIANISAYPEVQLQYQASVGVQYCLLNDFEKGVLLLNNAIRKYITIPSNDQTTHGRQHLANAYMSLGVFTSDGDKIKESLKIFLQETSNNDYSEAGKAKTWLSVGDCYLYLGDMYNAKDAYSKSFTHENSDLTKVFLARALVSTGDCDVARATLDRVRTKEFSLANHFDFALSRCSLAIKTGVKTDIDLAISLLKEVKTNEPYFKDIQHNLIVNISEIGKGAKCARNMGLLNNLNKVFILQPNIFGLGININAAIDCFLQRKNKAIDKGMHTLD